MDKQWPEDVTESQPFKYGLISGYFRKFDFEDDQSKFDESRDYDSDDSTDDRKCDNNTYHDVIKFLKQVRESRGYDVDTMVPRWLNSPFSPVSLKLVKNEKVRNWILDALNYALKHINAESEEVTGKTYEFVEFKKIVDADSWVFLFTFTARVHDTDVVKTLQAMVYFPVNGCCGGPKFFEWRVKPEPDIPPHSATSEDA